MRRSRFNLSIIGLIFSAIFTTAAAAQDRRPVVFIPGIVGSVLTTEDGDVVWGDIGSLRRSNFAKLNLLPTSGDPAPLVASDALRDIPLAFGAIEIGLYGDLIDFMTGKRSFLSALSGTNLTGQYVEDTDFFVFAYDWRRSNFANARKLNDFIEEKIPSGEYDLIAHSMGGLVTRIMLSGRGPAPLCTEARPDGLAEADYQALCTAIYGDMAQSYPTDAMSGPNPAAARMHTLVEMAVPHYGSVNVASTLLDGWGRVVERLLGGKTAIQDILLSLAAPVELLPTYENCCARGHEHDDARFAVGKLDEDYWLNLLLAFGETPCPYEHCVLKRSIFRNGMNNRAIIDEIMDEGLPATVEANHGVIGRYVKNTRQTVYVALDAPGGGQGVTYKMNLEGDGTVHTVSSILPANKQNETFANEAYVNRASHPFIVGDDNATTYIHNVLIKPVVRQVIAVSKDISNFADGLIEQLAVTLTPQIVVPGASFDVQLEITQASSDPFDRDISDEAEIEVIASLPKQDAETRLAPRLDMDRTRSRRISGDLVYTGTGFTAPSVPGVYTLRLRHGRDVVGQTYLYVMEEE